MGVVRTTNLFLNIFVSQMQRRNALDFSVRQKKKIRREKHLKTKCTGRGRGRRRRRVLVLIRLMYFSFVSILYLSVEART